MTERLPKLRRDQRQIALRLFEKGHIAVVMMGRRWGKTTLGGFVSVTGLVAGWRVAWVAPSFPQSRTLWRWVLEKTKPIHGMAEISRADRSIRFGKGELVVYSALAETTIRGNAFDLVVVDEAARVRGGVAGNDCSDARG